ncbi:MAG: NUDIX domain-containing protein [Sulfuricaulis sp.]|uniref:NUDIX domain-containing protein n=1 Tax=Sulfuricaulis sp. TaxID=2003553 RepID=UPI0025DC0D06|nr:NUDIX domain-containing protein [Sulfuricaulis sp.]MCR4348058.1 NUDIX domain-containing protein [Sulfuricaulis sp.]
MVKSALQARAERAAQRFRDAARIPIVLEFAGVPKAGKTTTLSQVHAFLRRCGFRAEVVVERASVCPIRDKKHANFNIWTACTTLSQILEKTQNPPRPDDPQILILDRGIFDTICWLELLEKLQRLRADEREAIEQFITQNDWRKRITAVFLMTVSPKDAMKREQGLLPIVGTVGSIMNEKVLGEMLEVTKRTAERMKDKFRIYEINTSQGAIQVDPKRTAEKVVDIILGVIEEQISEDVLTLPKSHVSAFFKTGDCIHVDSTKELIHLYESKGEYLPRSDVEKDNTRVQALPVVVVRNASGDVLRLRRREKQTDDLLHDKVVIWAGGHVRKEDAVGGSSISQCMVRELEEELRLRVQASALKPLGAIYVDVGERSSKHVAIVHEWRAMTDDVAVALSNSEFFERRGTSLSGSFATLDELAIDVEGKKLHEAWSDYIVREFLAKDSRHLTPRLL